ncbi:MAG: HAD-IC family P-type ATPase [Anaerolineae bacterium]
MQITSPTQPIDLRGLTETEATSRRQKGLGNNVSLNSSRPYSEIIRTNVFTFINIVLFGIGAVLVLLGLYTDALASVGIAFWNTVIGIVQEIRAKRELDKIALLTRPTATVIRAGQQQVIDPSQIVVGDILHVGAGDQIVVDGQVVGEGKMDVDESLLTGESDLIPKQAGDDVFSGSFCVNGSALYEAQKVGNQSVASQLTAGARAYRAEKTPLQVDVDFIVQLLVVLTMFFGSLFGMAALVANQPLPETVRIAAVITGLIPNGLFFMTSIAYAMGAVRMAGRGALIQHANAVESMSNVNTLCLDKTGTLTANRINLVQTASFNGDDGAFRRILGIYAASTTAGNRTSEALQTAISSTKLAVVEEVPFSSARKWSALAFDTAELKGIYVLGAPEMLRPFIDTQAELGSDMHTWAEQGLRVLLFAYLPDVTPLHNSLEQPQLPPNLTPLGVLAFSDELRAEAHSTLKGFSDGGIRLKIISGDNPNTVAALARQAGLSSDIQVVSGLDLDEMTDVQFGETAESSTVFGRITPQQKERLVDSLRARGHYVAMIGDGVNDVLSLKKAQIGISMQSGSQATRGVADIILMNDSFAVLPSAFSEGQRIVIGMVDIIRLFLARVVYQALIILAVAIVGLSFPITPVHQTLLSLFTVGIPTLGLAAWARPSAPPRRMIRSVLSFVLPAGMTIALLGAVIYVLYYVATFTGSAGTNILNPADLTSSQVSLLESAHGLTISDIYATAQADATAAARTMLTTVTTLAGLVLIIFVEPPTHFWTGGDELSGDWRPTLISIVLAAAYIVILLIPNFRDSFELTPLTAQDWLLTAVVVGLWTLVLRLLWRTHFFDRMFRLQA